MKGSYAVTISRITHHTFRVDDVNSPEEAEDVALGLIEEGEQGDVDVEDTTVYDSHQEE